MDITRCNGYELFSVGMVSKPVQEPTPEFQIQQEDFPALPGTQSKCRNNSLFYAEFEIILWLIWMFSCFCWKLNVYYYSLKKEVFILRNV